MNIKKKVLSLLTIVTMAASMIGNAVSVEALGYGEEWANYPGNGPTTPAATATPAVSTDASTSVPSTTAPAETGGSFSDVPPSHWAYRAVERCKASNWFSGYPDGTFHPNDSITRAEAAKVFVDFNSIPLSHPTSTEFTDLDLTAWYAPYVEAGSYLFPQRTTPSSQKTFQPEFPITREDTMYALVKVLRYDKYVEFADLSVLNMFSDQNSISVAVKPYVAVAVKYGLVSGQADGTIAAQDPLTRAEFATLLYRGTTIGKLEDIGSNKIFSRLEIDPSTYKEITVGESFEITATKYYTDNSEEDYSDKLNPFADGSEGVVVCDRNKVTGVGPGTVIINYNDNEEIARDQSLVVQVLPNPNETVEPTAEPTVEPIPEPDPAIAGVVKANVDKEEMPAVEATRYTVLVVDVSGSMNYPGKIDAAKTAAKDFCKTLFDKKSDDYVAVVSFDTDANVVCEFTNDLSTLENSINSLGAWGLTNIDDAYKTAETLLDGVTDPDVLAKSIVFMTDGYPEGGEEKDSGKYTHNDLTFYRQANVIYDTFTEIDNKGYDVYTVGFQTNYETEKFLKDIQNGGFYYASDDSKLQSVFVKIGEIIAVSGVNVELKNKDGIVVDSCLTNKGNVEFHFSVNPDTYTLEISAPGYQTYSTQVEVELGETVDLGSIMLSLE